MLTRMPKPSAPAVKLSGAEPGKIEIKTSPGQLSDLFVGSYGLERHMRVRVEPLGHDDDPSKKPPGSFKRYKAGARFSLCAQYLG